MACGEGLSLVSLATGATLNRTSFPGTALRAVAFARAGGPVSTDQVTVLLLSEGSMQRCDFDKSSANRVFCTDLPMRGVSRARFPRPFDIISGTILYDAGVRTAPSTNVLVDDGDWCVWDATTWTKLRCIPGGRSSLAAMTEDGRFIVARSDQGLRVLRTADMAEIRPSR